MEGQGKKSGVDAERVTEDRRSRIPSSSRGSRAVVLLVVFGPFLDSLGSSYFGYFGVSVTRRQSAVEPVGCVLLWRPELVAPATVQQEPLRCRFFFCILL